LSRAANNHLQSIALICPHRQADAYLPRAFGDGIRDDPIDAFGAFAMPIAFHQEVSRLQVSSMRLFGRGDSSLTERDFDLVDSFLI
jgi:hypothetical protein